MKNQQKNHKIESEKTAFISAEKYKNNELQAINFFIVREKEKPVSSCFSTFRLSIGWGKPVNISIFEHFSSCKKKYH